MVYWWFEWGEEQIVCVPTWGIEFVRSFACSDCEPVVGLVVFGEEVMDVCQEGE